jgi:uncharacterized membrane protein
MDGTSTERAESAFDLERLVFFSDAVFAIVITLLVLPLTSEVDLPPGEDLAADVWDLWPRVVSFVVSFLVVGQFWMVHHRMYGRLVRCDRGLLRINLVSLLTVSFMPFPAALLGEHSTADDQFPVVVFAASMTITSITFTATWLYAVRQGLVDRNLAPERRREFTTRSFVTSGVFLVSIGAAFLGLLSAALCWLVLLPMVRGLVVRRQRSRAVPA